MINSEHNLICFFLMYIMNSIFICVLFNNCIKANILYCNFAATFRVFGHALWIDIFSEMPVQRGTALNLKHKHKPITGTPQGQRKGVHSSTLLQGCPIFTVPGTALLSQNPASCSSLKLTCPLAWSQCSSQFQAMSKQEANSTCEVGSVRNHISFLTFLRNCELLMTFIAG